jgi:electron transfer flavoprotein alpha subunit/transcriptional regulator with XRE-family HTH domain
MMMPDTALNNQIWVVGDLRNQRLFGFSLNVLSKARQLAGTLSAETVMTFITPDPGANDGAKPAGPVCLLLEAAEQAALAHGADRVVRIEHPAVGFPRADFFARCLSAAVEMRKPRLVLFALTDFGRELAARTARICHGGLIADCADLSFEDGAIVGLCPAWGGQIMARITYAPGWGTGFATVQPHIMAAVAAAGHPGQVERLAVSDIKLPRGIRRIKSEVEPLSGSRLEEAQTVVVGGAGLGSMQGFTLVRQLSAAIGGQVAATRPAVLNRWVEEERMIGQTGKNVRPKLLFSIGTSGAIQYTAGIMEAGTIVAINRDPTAPIFQIADIGIVADAPSFLPLLTERAKQAVLRSLAEQWCDDQQSGAKEVGAMGEKIRKLRDAHNWTVEALAEATGQTPEFIAEVETDRISPPVGFLLRLAGALKVDPGTFLGKEAQVAIRDQRLQAYVRRTQNYSYQSLTSGAEHDHLRAFLVTIEPHLAHKPVAYKHQGEEFIFVMQGDLEFTLGSKIHVLKTGQSIHFNSDIPHKLKSLSSEPTQCLVVLYTL